MIVVVVYVDDIIFGRKLKSLSKQFSTKMQKEFEMTMLGELTFFLGLQGSQLDKGIFISQWNILDLLVLLWFLDVS